MKKIIAFLFIPFIISCQGQNKAVDNYSKNEIEQFLNEIATNAKVMITDFASVKKQPTNELLIFTRYPLSDSKLKEYNENNETLKNTDNDISDLAVYTFKSYELYNENDEKLQIVDNEKAAYLQEFSLEEHDGKLNQGIGINVKLNRKYEKLKGFITIEFEMPNNIKQEVKLPVDITINDTHLE